MGPGMSIFTTPVLSYRTTTGPVPTSLSSVISHLFSVIRHLSSVT
jgi:hypothetical protein